MKRDAAEIAGIISRFLAGTSTYRQEWNDFTECRIADGALDAIRKRCDQLDPLVNRPGLPDKDAMRELQDIVLQLGTLAREP